MPRRIINDHRRFRQVINGRIRRELKKLIDTGRIVARKPKGGKIYITIPRINIPRFVHGDNGRGVGRGEGKPGDVLRRAPRKGKKGNRAGDQPGEGIDVAIDFEDVLDMLGEELKLPNMKPKESKTYEEIRIRYNNLSRTGLYSLLHFRRTMLEAIKRMAIMGELDELHDVPGSKVPLRLILPINSDFRYRQYNEIKIPASNAVILFARDYSGSMDSTKCEAAMHISWWIDKWIRRFYKNTERRYFVHDTIAKEVDENKFYTHRYGGGTICSSVFQLMSQVIENKFPPEKYNIYIFYFTDGENWLGDDKKVVEIVKNKLTPKVVNLIGFCQINRYGYMDNSLLQSVHEALQEGNLPKGYLSLVDLQYEPHTGENHLLNAIGFLLKPELTDKHGIIVLDEKQKQPVS